MTDFEYVSPSNVDELSLNALGYLMDASEATGNCFPVEMALQQAKLKLGNIYLVKRENVLFGAFFVNFRYTHVGNTMTVVLLGGTKLMDWADEFYRFLRDVADSYGVDEVLLMGRQGWGRIFPKLEQVACVFREKLT